VRRQTVPGEDDIHVPRVQDPAEAFPRARVHDGGAEHPEDLPRPRPFRLPHLPGDVPDDPLLRLLRGGGAGHELEEAALQGGLPLRLDPDPLVPDDDRVPAPHLVHLDAAGALRPSPDPDRAVHAKVFDVVPPSFEPDPGRQVRRRVEPFREDAVRRRGEDGRVPFLDRLGAEPAHVGEHPVERLLRRRRHPDPRIARVPARPADGDLLRLVVRAVVQDLVGNR